MLRNGLPNVLIGFMAPRTTTGMPLVIPPSSPPALLLPRRKPREGVCFGGGIVKDFIVNLRAGPAGRFKAQADLDALERLNAHHRRRDPAVEPAIPRHARSQADRDSRKYAPRRFRRRCRGHLLLIDELPHLLPGGRDRGNKHPILRALEQNRRQLSGVTSTSAVGFAHGADKAEHLDTELSQKARAARPPPRVLRFHARWPAPESRGNRSSAI